MNRTSLAIAQYLDFDVTRLVDIALGVDSSIGEITQRFGGRARRKRGQFVGVPHDAHALAATTGCRFDQQRKP